MAELSGKQRRHLRALGQKLIPTLHVGHEGVSEAVLAQVPPGPASGLAEVIEADSRARRKAGEQVERAIGRAA